MGKRGNKTKKTAANPYAARLSAVSPRKETRGNNGKHGATGQKLILFGVVLWFLGLLAQSIRLDCRQFVPLRAAGASLVQIYSGFIYKGPSLVKEIVTHI